MTALKYGIFGVFINSICFYKCYYRSDSFPSHYHQWRFFFFTIYSENKKIEMFLCATILSTVNYNDLFYNKLYRIKIKFIIHNDTCEY